MIANEFAANFLITQSDLNHFIERVHPLYSKAQIEGFAMRNHVHPGIVAGQLRHRGEVGWSDHTRMLDKIRSIVIQSTLTDGWGHVAPTFSQGD